jgi:hypothetical protein
VAVAAYVVFAVYQRAHVQGRTVMTELSLEGCSMRTLQHYVTLSANHCR